MDGLIVKLGSGKETLEQTTVRMSLSSQPPLSHGESLQSKTFSSSPLHSTDCQQKIELIISIARSPEAQSEAVDCQDVRVVRAAA